MSYLPIAEENKEAPTGTTTNAPQEPPPPQTSGSGESTAVAPKGASSGSPTQFGSSASKLGAYLSANAPQITDQATNIAGNLNQQYGQTMGNIGQAVNQFGQQVKSGYTGFNQGAIDTAIQNALGGSAGESDVNAIQGQLQNRYQGPAAFEQTDPYSQTQADVMRAAQNAQLLTTQPGVRNYFQSNYGQEAPGMATLDTALLTSSPEAYGQVTQAAAPFAGLGNYLSQQAAQANLAVPAAQQEIAQGQQYAAQKLSGAEQNIQDQIANALAQRQSAAQAQNQSVLAGLQNRTISDQDLNALGMTRDQWNTLNQAVTQAATPQQVTNRNASAMSGTTNIDLGTYLQQLNPQGAFTAAGVATPEQLAQTRALQQLAAGQWTGNPLAGAEQVGNAPTGLNTFDYQSALNQAQGANTAQLQAAQAYVNAIQAGMDEEHAQQQAAKVANAVSTASYIMPPIGATLAVGKGAVDAGKTAYSKLTSSNPAQIAANVATLGMAPIAQGIYGGVKSAVNTVGQIFCFDGATPVDMADGTTKAIEEIGLGEKTLGGQVIGCLQAMVDEVYSYFGVTVSGKHAVKENGKWVRVENSKCASLKTSGQFKVYCLITTEHRIYANGIEFADYVETDRYEDLSMEESLEQLNVA